MTEPKVSERVWKIVNAAISAEVGLTLDPDSPHRFIESTAAKNLLLSAISEIEQRAEKWKEAAVAYQKWRDTYADDIADARLVAAIAALGDEWDEAVG